MYGSGIAHRGDWGKFRGQEREIDVKPDVHVMRVFKNGLTQAENEAVKAAQRLNPVSLHWPAWDIAVQAHQPPGHCQRCACSNSSSSGTLGPWRDSPAKYDAEADRGHAPYANALSSATAPPRLRSTATHPHDDHPPAWLVCERDGIVAGYAYASGPPPPTSGRSRPASTSTRSTNGWASAALHRSAEGAAPAGYHRDAGVSQTRQAPVCTRP